MSEESFNTLAKCFLRVLKSCFSWEMHFFLHWMGATFFGPILSWKENRCFGNKFSSIQSTVTLPHSSQNSSPTEKWQFSSLNTCIFLISGNLHKVCDPLKPWWLSGHGAVLLCFLKELFLILASHTDLRTSGGLPFLPSCLWPWGHSTYLFNYQTANASASKG